VTPDSIDTIGPLWNFVIVIVVVTALVVWAEWRQRKDDAVQRWIDERRDRAREVGGKDA
jgi:cytochrome c-type biogenesis protein CcmH/NrfF